MVHNRKWILLSMIIQWGPFTEYYIHFQESDFEYLPVYKLVLKYSYIIQTYPLCPQGTGLLQYPGTAGGWGGVGGGRRRGSEVKYSNMPSHKFSALRMVHGTNQKSFSKFSKITIICWTIDTFNISLILIGNCLMAAEAVKGVSFLDNSQLTQYVMMLNIP